MVQNKFKTAVSSRSIFVALQNCIYDHGVPQISSLCRFQIEDMKALVTATGTTALVKDIPIPEPGPKEILRVPLLVERV